MTTQSGNVLFLILIAVALFAALSYAVTQSTRGGQGNASKETRELVASQMMQYGASMRDTVTRLRVSNGCTVRQISFENTLVTGYANPEAPVNRSCHVFDAAGGGMAYQYPPKGAETTYAGGTSAGFEKYGFNANMRVQNIGSTNVELLMWTMTNREICDAVNARLGIATGDEVFANNTLATMFTGSYGSPGTDTLGNEAYPPGQITGCLYRAAYPGQYIFYAVLIER